MGENTRANVHVEIGGVTDDKDEIERAVKRALKKSGIGVEVVHVKTIKFPIE